MAKYYSGIGSRRTPEAVLTTMSELSEHLARAGWTLRSGHAPGADQAFEQGAGESAEIYLPWPNFENKVPVSARFVSRAPSDAAVKLAGQHHPGWQHLSRGARALHARNCHQVLGPQLDSKVAFVVCWTPDGSLDGRGRDSGGTGQALRLAVAYNIPVFNLARAEHAERVMQLLQGAPVEP